MVGGAEPRVACARRVFYQASVGLKTADLLESKFRNYEASLKPRAELESEPGI